MTPVTAGVVDLAADTYVWGYPLVTMHRTGAVHGRIGRGLDARQRLSTPDDRTVVAPNNDTLYASGWYDLRAGDLTIDVGAMAPGRYWSVMLLDAYTHVAYVCRRLHGSHGACVRVTYDPTVRPATDTALDVVPMGTPTVWLLARVVVDGPDDLAAARAALSQIHIYQRGVGPVSAAGVVPGPEVHQDGGLSQTDSSPAGADRDRQTPAHRAPPHAEAATRFFEALRDALAADPPASWHPPPPDSMDALLDNLPDEPVLAEGVGQGQARMTQSLGVDRSGNGWGTRSRGADFGDDVAYRAAYAKVSLAGHLPAENRSYTRAFDGSTIAKLRLPPGGEPPVDGFWSLCLYGRDLHFVDNQIDRYSIGDRTPGLRRAADGSLTITVCHHCPDDISNWLPAPAGPCFLVLRAYEGHAAVVDSRWFPPDLGTIAPSADQTRSAHAH